MILVTEMLNPNLINLHLETRKASEFQKKKWCTNHLCAGTAYDVRPSYDLSLQRVAKSLSIELSGFFPVNLTHVNTCHIFRNISGIS